MAEDVVKRVAANVRALRVEAGISMSELARQAGLSKAALSQLEGGQANPTVETLWVLAQALGVPFSDLTAEPAPPAVTVVRATEQEWIHGEPISSRLLTRQGAQGVIELYEIRVEPGSAKHSPAHQRGLTEHVVLQGGRMRLGPVEHPVVLEAGDAATYAADTGHLYEALEADTHGFILMTYPTSGTRPRTSAS